MVFQRAPPGFDHGVRAFQLRHGEQAAQHARVEQCADLRVDVLRTRVRQHECRTLRGRGTLTGGEEDGHAVGWCERIGDVPRQYPPGNVVNHGMQVGAGAAEQPDDGRIDVPHLVGARCTQPTFGFAGCTRSRGRLQPYVRTRRYHVEGEAQTMPRRCARVASVRVGTGRYAGEATMSSMAWTSPGVRQCGDVRGHDR